MDLNFLQRLGLVPPAASAYGDPNVPAFASDPMSAPPPAVAPGANVLQTMAAPAAAAPSQAIPATGPTRPARARSSILDSVGRIADVFAKVGGADALYQPTLDARQDRELSLADHDRSVDLQKLKIATEQGELGDAGRQRLSLAVRGTQALLAANPNADISTVFPLLAQRAGVDPEQAAALAGQLVENPGLLDGLAGFDDTTDKYGGSVVYAKGPDGKVVAFQPNLKGGKGRSILPDGFEAVDPLKFVDTGGTMTGVGTRSGEVTRILPKTERPGMAADRSSRERIAAGGNASRERIAAMPARGKPGATSAAGASGGNASAVADGNLRELEGLYDKLRTSGAIVSPKQSATKNILAYARSSGAGQIAEGALGTEAQSIRDRINALRPTLMQSIAKATGMSSKQLDSNSDVKLFMQTVTDPTKSYEANKAAIAGLRRLMTDNKPSPAASRPAARAPASRAPVRPRAGKPSISNW